MHLLNATLRTVMHTGDVGADPWAYSNVHPGITQISYYSRFIPHSLSFGILQKIIECVTKCYYFHSFRNAIK